MTIYRVNSVGGSNTAPYDTWGKGATSIETALAAATNAGDQIWVAHDHTETWNGVGTKTLSAGNSIQILCVNSGTDAAATGASLINSTDRIVTNGGYYYKVYWRGISFKAVADNLIIEQNGGDTVYENCDFWNARSAGAGTIEVGYQNSSSIVTFINCTLRFSHGGSSLHPQRLCQARFFGGGISGSTTAITNLTFNIVPSVLEFYGFDFSALSSSTSLFDSTPCRIKLVNCKLPAIPIATSTEPVGEVLALNCNSGDNHFYLYHVNRYGSTTAKTDITANDGALFDGTNKVVWHVQSTANASYFAPYVSPWISVYHSGTSAITPYVECMRTSAAAGSATKFYDDEMWAEFSFQGTANVPLATINNSSRMAPLGTHQLHANGVGTGGWSGLGANSASFKITPMSGGSATTITPAEIGDLAVRICVATSGGSAITDLYVDPQIRGRS